MRQVKRLSVTLAALIVAAGSLAACSRTEDEATRALETFLTGWTTGDLSAVSFLTPAGEPVSSAQVSEELTALGGDLAEQRPAMIAGTVTLVDDVATAPVQLEWPLPGGGTWRYDSEVRLTEQDGQWRVVWSPQVVHPELTTGDTLRLRRVPTTRGDIVDRDGEPLMTLREVRHVGLHPARLTDPDTTLATLSDALATLDVDISAAELAERAAEADPEHFVPVVTLRRADYDRIADRISPLPGVLVREDEKHLAPSRTFARALLGTVDEATAEDLERAPDLYAVGDQVGHGGLSQRYDELLRGVPGRVIVVQRATDDDSGEADEVELWRQDPVPGEDLAITLDRKVQTAAEAALATGGGVSALVAIRISDGSVVAVANMADGEANPVNLALTAQVPPGSTFKMVTGYALLAAGVVELDSEVPCPREVTVEGRAFRNSNGFGLGDVPFRTAMARSCNTTFVALAPQLPADGLAAAGAELGIGGDWDLGVETFTGSVSTGGSATERAAAAFGQGTTVVSPVAMAAATAAVARGAWLPPRLLVDSPDAEAVPLDEAAVADLRGALREVVTSGTARSLSGVPGGEVFGKTGSAEYQDGSEDTHAWFVGWQGDLAFAVFVAEGGSGADAAVPIARDFLTRLAS